MDRLRLHSRNSEDYYARKKAIQEEEKGRVHRRSVTERLRSGSTGTYRSRDAVNRYSYTGERKINADSSKAAQAAREYRLKRRSQTFDSATSWPEILRNPDRERRLYRTSTDPASVSDECSLSRESSLSSFDQPLSPRGSSHRHEEESSTIRTQCSSRTDDSGILTFRSNEQKDDFNLDLSPLSPVRPTRIEPIDSHVLTEKIKPLHFDTNLGHQIETEVKRLSYTSTESHLDEKKQNSQNTLGDTETIKPASPEITRKSSKKHRAPAPPPPPTAFETNIHHSSQSKPLNTSAELPKASSLESASNINIQNEPVCVISVVASVHKERRSSLTDKNSEVKDKTVISKTDAVPQRPPRLKKRSVTSEHSDGPPTPTILSSGTDSAFSVIEYLRKDNPVLNTKSESRSVEVKNKEDCEKEYSSINQSDTDLKENAVIVQTAHDLDKKAHRGSSDLSFSFDKNFIELTKTDTGLNQEQKYKDEPESEITPLLITSSSKKSIDTVRKSIDRPIERDSYIIQSEIMLRVSQNPVTSAAPDSSEASKVQMSADLNKVKPVRDDAITSGPSGAEGAPPPLPNSAPPQLPTTLPPSVTDISTEAEEVVIVEYTVPITLRSDAFEDNQISGFHEPGSSSVYLNGPLKVSSDTAGLTSTPTPDEVSLTHSKKGSDTEQESPSISKTISDLRSDFFGLKFRRPNKDVFETDLTETPTTTSRNSYFNDFQTEGKFGKRIGYGNSVDSDVSDSDSGVPISVGDETFSPGDSGRLSMSIIAIPDDNDRNRSSFVSSERRHVLSNESIESAFEDSLSVSSTSSVKLSHKSTGAADDVTATSAKQSKHSPANSVSLNPNSSVASQSNNLSPSIPVGSSKDVPFISHRNEDRFNRNVSETVGSVKHVTEIVQPKHTVVLKKEVSEVAPDSNASGSLPDLASERREVMLQSVVKRKVNTALSASSDPGNAFQEYVPGVGKSLKSSNPSEYGFVYSAERPTPPPEAGWGEKLAGEQKVNLYSENVLKEENTTEAVDRESIANLATTKRQWENIFTSQSTNQVESSIKKKAEPKWEVRLPYTEKHSVPSTNQSTEESSVLVHSEEEEGQNMFKKPVVTESAIEREIRLAHEREEMLRREKEERQRLAEKQKSQSQTFIASYATSSAESESNQPNYNELAEADRNPDLWAVERGEENKQQEHKSDNDINPNESIIEREIRLQREREAEVAKMRKLAQQQLHPQQQEQPDALQSEHYHIQHEEEADINHNQMKAVSYEDSEAGGSNEVENRIVRELQELKEREEEIRRLHSSLRTTHITDEVDGPVEARSPGEKARSMSANTQGLSPAGPPSSQVSWQRDVSSFLSQQRRESVDSTSSHSTGRAPSDIIPLRSDARVHPIPDSYSDEEDQKPDYFQKQETPIEREMRLARERENDLRKQKGLPEIDQKDENPYSSYGADQESSSSKSVSKPRSVAQPSDSLKKFASSRLQQELQEQKERELALLSEGKIITTSEQHIPSLKFMEVSGVKTDGTTKRNFVTRKSGSSYNESQVPLGQQEVTSPSGQSTKKTSAIAAGGQLFSYREFKQTAESKIERELREMKEREEELRKQRTGAAPQTPQ